MQVLTKALFQVAGKHREPQVENRWVAGDLFETFTITADLIFEVQHSF